MFLYCHNLLVCIFSIADTNKSIAINIFIPDCKISYICPDSIEKNSDYLKLGNKYCRVLFLKDCAGYIKDSMVTELTDFNRNMMLSIDVLPRKPLFYRKL